jgi:hypothetical protein
VGSRRLVGALDMVLPADELDGEILSLDIA